MPPPVDLQPGVAVREKKTPIALACLPAAVETGSIALTSATQDRRRSQMIVMFSARRLKPGAWDQFRRAWDPGEDLMPPGFQRAYHARNIRDEDEIISFGIFDMTEDEYRSWRADADAEENQRVDALSAFVENDHVSGVFEVIDTVDP
jgi:heme-degrading monooxygenase HmoA